MQSNCRRSGEPQWWHFPPRASISCCLRRRPRRVRRLRGVSMESCMSVLSWVLRFADGAPNPPEGIFRPKHRRAVLQGQGAEQDQGPARESRRVRASPGSERSETRGRGKAPAAIAAEAARRRQSEAKGAKRTAATRPSTAGEHAEATGAWEGAQTGPSWRDEGPEAWCGLAWGRRRTRSGTKGRAANGPNVDEQKPKSWSGFPALANPAPVGAKLCLWCWLHPCRANEVICNV